MRNTDLWFGEVRWGILRFVGKYQFFDSIHESLFYVKQIWFKIRDLWPEKPSDTKCHKNPPIHSGDIILVSFLEILFSELFESYRTDQTQNLVSS